jgi:flagellar biosynthesis/type III secretory pathway protein FliH
VPNLAEHNRRETVGENQFDYWRRLAVRSRRSRASGSADTRRYPGSKSFGSADGGCLLHPRNASAAQQAKRCREAAARDLLKQAQDANAKAKAAGAAFEAQIDAQARIADAYAKGTAEGRQQELIERAHGWQKPNVTCRTQRVGSTTFRNCD